MTKPGKEAIEQRTAEFMGLFNEEIGRMAEWDPKSASTAGPVIALARRLAALELAVEQAEVLHDKLATVMGSLDPLLSDIVARLGSIESSLRDLCVTGPR